LAHGLADLDTSSGSDPHRKLVLEWVHDSKQQNSADLVEKDDPSDGRNSLVVSTLLMD
jgi:hypothetical protein